MTDVDDEHKTVVGTRLDPDTVQRLDEYIEDTNADTRSEATRDLVRDRLAELDRADPYTLTLVILASLSFGIGGELTRAITVDFAGGVGYLFFAFGVSLLAVLHFR